MSNHFEISPRPVALVTGVSAGGTGYHLCLALLKRNYRMFITVRLEGSGDELKEKGVEILILDVSSADSVKACLVTFLERSDSLDVLINNAGYGTVEVLLEADLTRVREVPSGETNVFGLLTVIQAFAPLMAKQGRGTIASVGSLNGVVQPALSGAYAASKAAVHALSDSLRLEGRPPRHSRGALRQWRRRHIHVHNEQRIVNIDDSSSAYANLEPIFEARKETLKDPHYAADPAADAEKVAREICKSSPTRTCMLERRRGQRSGSSLGCLLR